jgi:hypothetical protein
LVVALDPALGEGADARFAPLAEWLERRTGRPVELVHRSFRGDGREPDLWVGTPRFVAELVRSRRVEPVLGLWEKAGNRTAPALPGWVVAIRPNKTLRRVLERLIEEAEPRRADRWIRKAIAGCGFERIGSVSLDSVRRWRSVLPEGERGETLLDTDPSPK